MKLRDFLRGFSVLNLILLVFGGMALWVSITSGHIFQHLKPAQDYDYVLENGLEEGDHIEGEIYYSLGSFATKSSYTQYKDYRTADKVSGYYYMIPVGEKGMAAVYVRKEDRSIIEQTTDETYEYLNGGERPVTLLEINGVAVKMEENLAGLEKLFKEQLQELGYQESDIEAMLADTGGEFLVIEGPADVTTMYAMTAVGFILVVLAVFLFIRRYRKQKRLQAKTEAEWTKI